MASHTEIPGQGMKAVRPHVICHTTGAGFSEAGTTYPATTKETFPRTAWLPKPGAKSHPT